MKKICVVTGTRAEYGLLRWVMEGIRQSRVLELQLVATGMHLSPEFGMTVNAIEADGFKIDRKVEMLLSSDTPIGVAKSMGLGMIGFADALADLQPDLMLVLGDRYEIFAAASAAMIARIPIAHLHGGETTEGAFDEAIRHSITKMSHLHFVAAEEYRRHVIQLGEHPDRVFNVGGLGIDNILRLKLLTREELEADLDFKFLSRNLLITFHPVTLEHNTSADQMQEILAALAELEDVGLIFTMPNADTEGRVLFQKIKDFCLQHSNARAYTSLGQLRYLSCIQHVDGVVGNSSSGLAEVPSFKKGTINIGDRQRGRIKAASVIDSEPNRKSIRVALDHIFSAEFQTKLSTVENPYGNAGASDAIVRKLESQFLGDLLKKRFYDLPGP
ncbi:GDP/UDP-N,N'-diacetylbacillosamine 2-epimerase (hydrolysing) [Ectothiorhodosinus mongolicus]|uniref:GDP/UDP-N,N'-diacetylbacillosamine 2-epimerase (Hydrolysing) n=1 Tax=Ectothiorhodosinus mongolicus TaxID=233100 RepID=A0A1R3VU16_9GAMM|nr:UDP-N-acetylglucosamine 2-epimerase [Ectothiorhodosinus mongolicus]ULX56804.1 UDP-N-acetylglucosamine 2-epimerase (hydrolyzing) [Ectothiorhodosinus mongolicus]SIT68392.1 GDP/UDP-N,N'-diacetylbacillosamine 2-epimerase (hydrolysing) [Ectothiorhodosinus mongolicus]